MEKFPVMKPDNEIVKPHSSGIFPGIVLGMWLAGTFAAFLAVRLYHLEEGVLIMGLSVFWPFAVCACGGWPFMPRSPGVFRLIAFCIFTAFCVFSSFSSYDPMASIIFLILTLGVFFLALQINSYFTPEQLETGFKIYTFLMVILLTGFALHEYKAGVRLGEVDKILNPNAVAMVSTSVVMTATAFRFQLMRFAMMIPPCVIIYLAHSRTSAITVILAVAIIMALRVRLTGMGKKLSILVVFIIAAAVAVYYSVPVAKALEDFFELNSRYRGIASGFSGRFQLWGKAWQIIMANPIVGVGFRAHESVQSLGNVHNGYLALLVEIGFLGFAGAMYLVFSGIINLWRDARGSHVFTNSILAGLCCGYLFLAMFERYFFNVGNPTSLLFIIGIMRPLRTILPADQSETSLGPVKK
jgi:O-antigen ligase